MYRILHMDHHRTGNQWCIYPMYDYAHGQSDSIERVTHSMCTLEFDNNRSLYNWFIEQLGIFPSRQYEFDRLSLTHTLLSKRKLLKLVEEGLVEGWDDPRMPTLSGMRRRGYTSTAIRNFCASVGVSKTNGITQLQQLEYFLRQDLNRIVPRVMCVQKPLRVVIENYPDDLVEEMDAINNPEDSSAGSRKIPFSKTLYIEDDDFREDPPNKFYRLSPGREVRLRYAYLITCKEVIKDSEGRIVELVCTYDPATRGGNTPDGRKVKSTIHWVSADHALPAEVRLYDNLFVKEDPNEVEEGHDFTENLNPDSLQVLHDCKIEPVCEKQSLGLSISLSALVTIVLIATRSTNWCSIGPLACAIRGPRSKNAQRPAHECSPSFHLNVRSSVVLFRVNSWIVSAQKTRSTKAPEIKSNPFLVQDCSAFLCP